MSKYLAGATALALVLSSVVTQARSYDPIFDRHSPIGYVGPRVSVHPYGTRPHRAKSHRKVTKITVPARITIRRRAPSNNLANVTPILAAKIREIITACGTTVVSAFRPGARIAGSGHASLHSRFPAEAVDVAGNPACVYSHLKGWKGGYSTDYAAVRHVHISFAHDRRERGVRFVHYGTPRYAERTRWATAR